MAGILTIDIDPTDTPLLELMAIERELELTFDEVAGTAEFRGSAAVIQELAENF